MGLVPDARRLEDVLPGTTAGPVDLGVSWPTRFCASPTTGPGLRDSASESSERSSAFSASSRSCMRAARASSARRSALSSSAMSARARSLEPMASSSLVFTAASPELPGIEPKSTVAAERPKADALSSEPRLGGPCCLRMCARSSCISSSSCWQRATRFAMTESCCSTTSTRRSRSATRATAASSVRPSEFCCGVGVEDRSGSATGGVAANGSTKEPALDMVEFEAAAVDGVSKLPRFDGVLEPWLC